MLSDEAALTMTTLALLIAATGPNLMRFLLAVL